MKLYIHCSYIKFQGRNVVIFYGSQTGTAEEFAGRLAKDCNRYGMKGMAADPEEFDMVRLGATWLHFLTVCHIASQTPSKLKRAQCYFMYQTCFMAVERK